MKLDQLEIVGLPKSFKVYNTVDYLYPKGEEPDLEDIIYDEYLVACDEEKGEDAIVVFKYGESTTGVYLLHNTLSQSMSLHLSPWAVEVDVLLYADIVNAVMKKHPRAKLYDKFAPLKNISDEDVERMISDRKKFLKRMLTTKKEFTMEGLHHNYTLCPEHLRPASSIDMQVFGLQRTFTRMQWETSEEE